MSQYTAELEELQAVLATQVLLAIESVDISECLGDEFDKSARFQKPTTLKEILEIHSSYSCVAIFRHVGIKSRTKRQPGRALALKVYASALAYATLCLCLSHV